MDDITKAEHLENAAELLKTEGWGRGELKDYEGKRCAIGSIGTVLGVEQEYSSSEVYLDARVIEMAKALDLPQRAHSRIHDPVGDVIDWNDREVPGVDSVVDHFLATAKDLRNRGGVDGD